MGPIADCLQSTKRQPVPKGLVMCRNVFVPLVAGQAGAEVVVW
jgi:hypothetical protein